MRRKAVWFFCAGLLFSLGLASAQTNTAYESTTDAVPCLNASADIATFRAAFEAAGWAEVHGAARSQAIYALGEIISIDRRWPKIGDPDRYAEFIRKSHTQAERDLDLGLVMVRDSLTVGVRLLKIKDTISVECYLTGAEIPGLDQVMTRPDAHMLEAIGIYVERPLLPGYEGLHYGWILIDPLYDADPPPLAVQSIIVSYHFPSDTPPVPPLELRP